MVPTFCGVLDRVWYGSLAAQRVGGYGPDRPSPVSGRLGPSAGGGVWSRGGLRERTTIPRKKSDRGRFLIPSCSAALGSAYR